VLFVALLRDADFKLPKSGDAEQQHRYR
jgi:hypothetical protein